jgi:4-amino-4-deoxychorismate lyase
MVTRGCDNENRIYNYEGEPSTILVLPFPLLPHRIKPMRLCVSPEARGNESIYRHKTISYLGNLTNKTFARKNGFDDAIILNGKKELLETTTANIFFIIKDKIITPPEKLFLLNGIMRQNLLALGSIKKYSLTEGSLTLEDLKKVDECFITSAILEICPVTHIEGHMFSLEKTNLIQREWSRIRQACSSRYI